MSDPQLDRLAGSARNRGLKLVRSRVRKAGKPRFGKAGLEDASGKPVFGMDARGPIASAQEVEDYLRQLETKDWGASLGNEKLRPKKAKANRVEKSEKPRERPVPPPRPQNLAAKPQIRSAKPSDSARLAGLIGELGHPIDEKTARSNLGKLKALAETPLVAILGRKIVGVAGFHRTIALHRAQPLGRITLLIVDEQARGRGIGRMLTNAVEDWCRKEGCKLIEVTSNDRRTQAHGFYRHLGYERTSIRFAKTL